MPSKFLTSGPVESPGIGCLDASFSYVWLNERLAEINGLPVAAHRGKPADLAGPFGETIAGLLSLAAGGAGECQGEAWRESPQTHEPPRCYRITLVPRRQAGGELSGSALLVADVTREKSAEWALAEHFHEQRMFADVSARFGGGQWRELAHELRNRLTPMLTVAQMLKKAGELDAETLAWAGQSMEKKVLELSGLVSAWHQGGPSPAGGWPPPAPVDLRQLALQALAAVRPLLGGRSLSLPSDAAWALGNPSRLLSPVALCLLQTAKPASGLDIGIRTESGQALLVIGGQVARPQESPEPRPHVGENAGNPPGMGLSLAKMLFEEQQGGLAVSGMEAGSPRGEIIARLPLARPPASLSP